MGAQAVRLSNVDINNALENKDFEVLFQPIFDLSNGALARMETFVRWRHPSLGVLPPGAFISFFESQGRMSELTRYVLDVALESYAEWRGPYAPGFSINLALTDLTDEAFAPHLEKVLRDKEFPADLVTLECPMPAVNAAMDALNAAFERLQETGARLAIEVRGRANEFLRTVDPFPFDEIKTGGSSILRFARTVRGPGLSAISDLLDIAQKANAVTTAVGVEDQASLAALRGLGFTAAQGNHLAKVGDLKDFRPSRVNDVRESLELPALNGDELSALFRTAAPEPKAPAPETEPPAPASDMHASEPDDNEQSVSATTEDTLEPATAEQNAEAAKTDAERQALLERARKKAKAIALAKRAKARDARKAAAIKRAKAKVVRNNEATPELPPLQESDDAGLDPVAEPRALQDRLAQEFKDSETAAEEEINAAFDAGLDDGEETDITANFGVTEPIVDETPAPKESAVAHQAEDNVVAENEEAPHPAPLATDEQLSESNEPGKQSIQLQLPIGPARAHFRPGIIVRSMPEAVKTTAPSGVSGSVSDDAPAPTQAPKFEPPQEHTLFEDPAAPKEVKPIRDEQEKQEVLSHAAAPADTPSGNGSLYADEYESAFPEQEALAEEKQSQRPRKNFLTRRYRVVPTHFWPKSWKRAMRRRAEEKALAEDAQT